MSSTITPKAFSAKPVTEIPANLVTKETVNLGPITSWTGYASMTVARDDGRTSDNSLFYWFVQSRNAALANAPSDTPVVIWLNGGPGASSLAGLFMENGPFALIPGGDGSVEANESAWNREVHLLYWDQPVGTGFSFTSDDSGLATDETEVREQFCRALDMFFASDEFAAYRDCPLYIVGESYAGKYIPNISVELIEHPERYPSTPKLTGAAIGDGWMQPGQQTRVQIDFGLAMAFVDTKQHARLSAKCDHLDALIAGGEFTDANTLGSEIMAELLSCGGNPDIYDVRSWRSLDTVELASYLDAPAVQQALGVDRPWECADNGGKVGEALAADVYAPATDVIARMLAAARDTGFRVLFYTGDFDMSCGFLGTEAMLQEFDFPRLDGSECASASWRGLDRQVWVHAPATTLGYVKSLDNLTQITVVDAGHLVPMDRPEVSRLMLENWVFERPFAVIDPTLS